MLKSSVAPQFLERRKRLMAKDPDGAFVFFGAEPKSRNYYHHYPFRQDSNFLYLTDFDEESAILVLVRGQSYLFVLERSVEREMWEGERYGPDRAKTLFQMQECFIRDDFERLLPDLIGDAKKCYYTFGSSPVGDAVIPKVLQKIILKQGKGRHSQLPLIDPTAFLSQMRVVKDGFEVELIKRAAQASVRAHQAMLKRAKFGMLEAELEAEFRHTLSKSGVFDYAYQPIFASGLNSTTLHSIRNNDYLKNGDLILIDAGGEFDGYASDITQTFPVSARFSPEQKAVYQEVLSVNRQVALAAKPGSSLRDLQEMSSILLIEALIRLKVLEGDVKTIYKNQTYRKYYPHGIGHHLGLDVHDSAISSTWGVEETLQPGMVITNEPGLYFRDRGSPYYGIGVRIEDDLLITQNGNENLTQDLPREVEEIEELRQFANP